MRKTLILFFIVFTLGSASAQVAVTLSCSELLEKAENYKYKHLDSAVLLCELAQKQSKTPQENLSAYRTLGYIYEENNKLAYAQEAYKKGLLLAENSIEEKERLDIYTDWAIVHKKNGQYSVANEYHQKTIDIATKLGDWEMVENGYHGLGTMFSMMSNFDKSIACYYKSIEAAEKWGNTEGVILSKQNISNILLKAKNIERARTQIEETYNMALAQKDTARIASVLLSFAQIEKADNRIEAALQKMQAARAIFEKNGNLAKLSETLSSIADIYVQQQDYKLAKQYFDQSLPMADVMMPYARAMSFSNYGKFNAVLGENDKALTAFQTSLQLTDSLGFKEIALENHLGMSAILEKQGNYQAAFEHISMANKIREGFYKDDIQKNMSEQQYRFDVEKRDLMIASQQNDLQNSRNIRWVLGLGMLVLSILLGFTWWLMKAKQDSNIRLELLMKELHHRVKNNLQMLTSMFRLQARKSENPAVVQVLNDSRLRLESMSLMHQQLYSYQDIKQIDLQKFIYDLIEKLSFSYNIEHLKTKIQVSIDKTEMDKALAIGLIINELLTNSLKHAFENTENPRIEVYIDNQHILYKDNGIGMNTTPNIEQQQSIGLQLISSFAKQLKATYLFKNENGLSFEMTFLKP
jgi:two-component sensor histidine kinase